MFPLTGSLSLAAAGAILALATASIPARADELAQNLGPLAPRLWVGSKRIIALSSMAHMRSLGIAVARIADILTSSGSYLCHVWPDFHKLPA